MSTMNTKSSSLTKKKDTATAGFIRRRKAPVDLGQALCAAITHEAHHRGQICHWARELGAPITPEQQLKLWEWDKRWKEIVNG
jgi:uncharacterized damage-inducible protein DinB